MAFSKLQEQEITEVLSSFGLKEKEQRVYRSLLTTGNSTLTPLSNATGLPPTTVESVLNRLYDDGLVTVTKRGSRRNYEALDPVALKQILERKVREVNSVIPLLQSLKENNTAAAKVKIYHRERYTDIFDSAMRSKSKLIYEIVAPKNFQEILGEKYHFTRRRLEHGVHLKSLRVESKEIKKYSRAVHTRELREARFLPRELTFGATVLFWDRTVAIFTTKSEGSAVVIESPALTETYNQLFNLLWSLSRPMENA